MKCLISIIIIGILLISGLTVNGQNGKANNYLISFADTAKDEYGYKNQKGEIIIEPGKYRFCFTDTFRTYAIVLKSGEGFLGIDRQQNILYKVFSIDNGPDYTSDGLFRIMKDGKIGYADSTTGKIIIKPQFDCAYPFEKGEALVSNNCTKELQEEHSIWKSNNWFYINKKGKKVIHIIK